LAFFLALLALHLNSTTTDVLCQQRHPQMLGPADLLIRLI
jgi:hypothetical protein